jgi:hypothetical protein
MKAPVVYPVSADLSALLGAAVDVDAAWSIDSPITPPIDQGPIEASEAIREWLRQRNERRQAAQVFRDGFIPRGQR